MSGPTARERLEHALGDHGCTVRGSAAQCPAHEDRNASLSIGSRKDGDGVIIRCHAGCETDAILEAVGMSAADLFDEPRQRQARRVVAEYDYTDENGALLFRSVRYEPKEFRQYRMVNGRKEHRLNGTRRVLYRLPQVLEAVRAGKVIYVCEGEKDVGSIERAGAVATCNPMGAGKWRDEFAAVLAGADVVIIADRDEPGRKHAAQVADSVRRGARSVRVVEPVAGKDATDHLAAGHRLGDFADVDLAAPAEDGPPAADSGDDPIGARLEQLRAALLDSAALDFIPAPQPVIDGFLYRDSLAWLHGKPGNGKSFVALDWAACVAAGLPWQGCETMQGPVLYLAAEGKSGLRPRVRAWEDYAQCVMGVVFLPVAVQLLVPVDIAALAAVAAEMHPALVVLDTQARVTTGFDENSAKDMGLFVAAADRLREATGACVLTVHHEARAGENMRGSTALEGAATSIMRATKEGSLITLSTSKQKDAPAADEVRLTLMPRLASAVLMSHGRAGNFGLLSDSEGTVLGTLRELFVGRSATPTEIIDMTKLSKSTVYRALSALVSKGKLVNAGTEARPRYVLTDAEIPTLPRTSQVPPPKLPTSHHPFRGGTDGKPGEADSEAWPADTIGGAQNAAAS